MAVELEDENKLGLLPDHTESLGEEKFLSIQFHYSI